MRFTPAPAMPYWANSAVAATANALFAVEGDAALGERRDHRERTQPGGVWTPLQRHWSDEQRAAAERQSQEAERSGLFQMKSPEQGAATSVFLATSPLVAGVGGRYFEDRQQAEVVEQLRGSRGVLPHALDPTSARRLWDLSQELIATARTTLS